MTHKHADILRAIANGETEFEAMHPKSGEWKQIRLEGVLVSLADPIGQQFQFRVKKKFNREERYLVLKYSDLNQVPDELMHPFRDALCKIDEWMINNDFKEREYVVVESDWKCYDQVWKLVEAEALK